MHIGYKLCDAVGGSGSADPFSEVDPCAGRPPLEGAQYQPAILYQVESHPVNLIQVHLQHGGSIGKVGDGIGFGLRHRFQLCQNKIIIRLIFHG